MSSALEGLRILDLTRLLPGGYATLLLADLGADVIKVEDMGMGDYVRWAPPYYEGAEESANSALYMALNRGKRAIRLDLKTEGGRDALRRLVRDADVLVEGFRPGVMDRLGVGYDVLREDNPRLVYCAITGYGQDGPMRDRSGHDMNYLAQVGLLGLTGEKDGPPIQSAGQIADIGGGGLMAVFGILAALQGRERTGVGQFVDVSMAHGALSWLLMEAARTLCSGEEPTRGELGLAGGFICYRPYRCADGWVTLGALEPKFWAAFCHGTGREDLMDKAFEGPGSAAHGEVEAIFRERTRAEWADFAGRYDCCLEPVLSLGEALDSELVRARGMVADIDQPGADGARLLGAPVAFSGTPADTSRAAPALGADTEAVLAEAGYSTEEIAALVESGAAGTRVAERAGSFMG